MMSSPAMSAQAAEPEFSWKSLFIKAAGFGAGFALMIAILAGIGIWYWNRPKAPKAWNTSAIQAEWDYAGTEGDENTIAFYYTLINNTDFDYDIQDANILKLGAKLARENSLSVREERDYIRPDSHIFVPAHGRSRFGIHLKYPFSEREKPEPTADELHDFRIKVAKYIMSEMQNLDGFCLYDETHRYELVFPAGWRDTATEPLKVKPAQK